MTDSTSSEDSQKGNRHPKSAYAAKYPYNRVEVTESGHEIHYDDTPGNERIRIAHKTGTYFEISPKGRKVEMVVSDHHQYVKGGHTQTVDKNLDIKVAGSARNNVGGHSHSEIKGDSTSAIGKDSKTTVGGDSTSAVQGDHVHGVVGEMHFKAGKQIEVKADGQLTTKVDGVASMDFGDTLNISAKNKIVLTVGSSTITMESGKITIKAGEIVTESSGATNINAGGDVVTKGATTKIQGGGAGAPPTTFS